MNQLNSSDKQQIKQLIDDTIGFFINSFRPESARFPLMPNTFTIWRLFAYKQIQKLSCYQQNRKATDFQFYLHSECGYLHKWLSILKQYESQQQMLNLPIRDNISSQLLFEYSNILWKYTLYCELFLDFVNYPHLTSIFTSSKQYKLNSKLTPINSFNQSTTIGGKIIENVSSSLIKKTFGAIAQKMFTRTFLLQASTLAIRLNPMAIVASVAFSQVMGFYQKQKKEEEGILEMQEIIKNLTINADELQQNFEMCIGLLGQLLRGDETAKEEFRHKVMEVAEVDWLQVTTVKDEEGWQVVILQGEKPQKSQKIR